MPQKIPPHSEGGGNSVMHLTGEPNRRLVGQKEPNTANDHRQQRLIIYFNGSGIGVGLDE